MSDRKEPLAELVTELCECVENGDEKSVLNMLDAYTQKHDKSLTETLVNTPHPHDDAERTALMFAAENGHDSIVELLFVHGADASAKTKYGWTALIYAARNGCESCMNVLLHHGADSHAKDNHGRTALLYAADSGHEACLNILLRRGADPNLIAGDHYGSTALMYAADSGHDACIDVLLRHGADINAQASSGFSALMAASQNGHDSCVDLLLLNGADMNAENDSGWTALTHAADFGCDACIDVLLRYGADPNAKDTHGRTALMYASRQDDAAGPGPESVLNMLISHSRTSWESIVELLECKYLTGMHDARYTTVESAVFSELMHRQMCAIYPCTKRELWPAAAAAAAVTVAVADSETGRDPHAHSALLGSFFNSPLFDVNVLRIIREYASFVRVEKEVDGGR
jgi:ankyrin repeat protein